MEVTKTKDNSEEKSKTLEDKKANDLLTKWKNLVHEIKTEQFMSLNNSHNYLGLLNTLYFNVDENQYASALGVKAELNKNNRLSSTLRLQTNSSNSNLMILEDTDESQIIDDVFNKNSAYYDTIINLQNPKQFIKYKIKNENDTESIKIMKDSKFPSLIFNLITGYHINLNKKANIIVIHNALLAPNKSAQIKKVPDSDFSIRYITYSTNIYEMKEVYDSYKKYNSHLVYNTYDRKLFEIFNLFNLSLLDEINVVIYDDENNYIFKGSVGDKNLDELINEKVNDYYKTIRTREIMGFSTKFKMKDSSKQSLKSELTNYNSIDFSGDEGKALESQYKDYYYFIIKNLNRNHLYNKNIISNQDKFFISFITKKIPSTQNDEDFKKVVLKSNLRYNQSATSKSSIGIYMNDLNLKYSEFFNSSLVKDKELEEYLKLSIEYFRNLFYQMKFMTNYIKNKVEMIGLGVNNLIRYEISNTVALSTAFDMVTYLNSICPYILDFFSVSNFANESMKESVYLFGSYKTTEDKMFMIKPFILEVFKPDLSKFTLECKEDEVLVVQVINMFNEFSLGFYKTMFPQIEEYLRRKEFSEKINGNNSVYDSFYKNKKIRIVTVILAYQDEIPIFYSDDLVKDFIRYTKTEELYFYSLDQDGEIFNYLNLDDNNFLFITPLPNELKDIYMNYQINPSIEEMNSLRKISFGTLLEIYEFRMSIQNYLTSETRLIKVNKETYNDLKVLIRKISQIKFKDLNYTPSLSIIFNKWSEFNYDTSDNVNIVNEDFYVAIYVKCLKKDIKYLQPFIDKIEKVIQKERREMKNDEKRLMELSKKNKLTSKDFKTIVTLNSMSEDSKIKLLSVLDEDVSLKVGEKCIKCSEKLGYKIPHFYCFTCDIYLCEKCGNKYDDTKESFIEKLPHQHYLIYINVVNDDGMKNISLQKFSFNVFDSFILEKKFELANYSCNGCQGSYSDKRHICLSCRPGPFLSKCDSIENYGYCDLCSNCFESIRNGNYLKDKSLLKKLEIIGHNCNTHVYLRCDYNSGSYYSL